MGGGLLQLVAHGAQDAYLSGNPQITFWKGLFKRHTNFAMEPFRVRLTGVPAWGNKQSVTLARHADLLYSTYLDVVLPSSVGTGASERFYDWNNEQGRLGYNLLDYVELEIGGQAIDRLYSEYLYLWDTLTADASTSYKLYQMVGGGGDSRRLDAGPMAVNTADDSASVAGTGKFYGYRVPSGQGNVASTGRPSSSQVFVIPLPFSYTRNPGAALPLIALQYHEVKINILWNKWQFVTANFMGTPPPPPTSASIYVDYIYLDVDERRRMAQESHEYLIEQVQFNEEKGLAAGANRVDLTFNHPVKELIWVVQPDRFTNCKIADKFNNSAANYGSPRPCLKPSSGQVAAANVTDPSCFLGTSPRLTPFTYTYLDQSWPTVTPAGSNITVNTAGFTQPVFEQHLQINGQDRLDRRGGDYYNRVQPYQHHSGTMKPVGFDVTPYMGTGANSGGVSAAQAAPTAVPSSHRAIYTYSFALKPEENQPSGTCNFSRIDTATIVMNMSGNYVVDENTDNVWNARVYAINYNILRVMSGMAGLAYSN
jgi:hypothetical protein